MNINYSSFKSICLIFGLKKVFGIKAFKYMILRTNNLPLFVFDNEPSRLLRFEYNLGNVEMLSWQIRQPIYSDIHLGLSLHDHYRMPRVILQYIWNCFIIYLELNMIFVPLLFFDFQILPDVKEIY